MELLAVLLVAQAASLVLQLGLTTQFEKLRKELLRRPKRRVKKPLGSSSRRSVTTRRPRTGSSISPTGSEVVPLPVDNSQGDLLIDGSRSHAT